MTIGSGRKKLVFTVTRATNYGVVKGYAVIQNHENCYQGCCPRTLAEFYGPLSKARAQWFKAMIEQGKAPR